MPDPVFLHQLDDLAHQGCSNPFCQHDHDDKGLVLTSRCHVGAGVRVEYAPDRPDLPCGAVLRLRCRRCTRPVIEIALQARVDLVPTCRHGRALDVDYQDGQVTVRCHRCDAPQATADVAPYVPH